ncbi:MAG: hypothetical protein QM784_35015 [Polyangiaceae bacterium]
MSEIRFKQTFVQPRLREALDRIRPEMAALEPEELVPVDEDPIAAVAMVRGALQQVKPIVTEIKALPGFRGEDLDRLDLYASALVQAHTSFLGVTAPPEHLVALVEEVTFFRELLLSDFRALVKLGLLGARSVEGLKGPAGYRNVAADVSLLAHLLKRSWREVEGKTCVTEPELARAEILAEQLTSDLGLREMEPAAVTEVTRERMQVYTLFVRAYEQLRRAVEYLRWDCGDAEILAPPLIGSRRPKRNSDISRLGVENSALENGASATSIPTSPKGASSVPPKVASIGSGALPEMASKKTLAKASEVNAGVADVDPFVL